MFARLERSALAIAGGAFLLLALGAYSFCFFAAIEYALPRLLRRAPAFRPASQLHMWASFAGAAIAGLALLGAGLIKGAMFGDGAPFGDISAAMTIPYGVAAAGYGLFAAGAMGLLVHVFMLYTSGRVVAYEVTQAGAAPAAAH